MKKRMQDKVYEQLQELFQTKGAITAAELSEIMGISRQNVSHYLSRLLEEGRVDKIKGKPILWKVKFEKIQVNQSSVKKYSVFQQLVGHNGSVQEIIDQCISAVKYPPNGLNILINGESGVGKSLWARKIYEYAKHKKIISADAPFVVLNCADYADNPELMSATLFGYKKGAFTGADINGKGLLQAANNGYLFLDEVHRLSSQSQEKLFLFLDSGKYRPIGENERWFEANVRFIFATTEKSEDYLLDTFTRRIQVNVKLPTFDERPLSEKLELIGTLFYNEAKTIKKNLLIEGEVLALLCQNKLPGNIGKLKNVIKISCANAFSEDNNKDQVKITQEKILKNLRLDTFIQSYETFDDLLIEWDSQPAINEVERFQGFQTLLNSLIEKIMNLDLLNEDSWYQIKLIIQQMIQTLNKDTSDSFYKNIARKKYQTLWHEIIAKKYGLQKSTTIGNTSSKVFVNIQHMGIHHAIDNAMLKIKIRNPRAFYVTQQFVRQLDGYKNEYLKMHTLILTILLSDYIDETIQLKGLLLAHGESTASSIQTAVNQLCEEYVFEAIDMPIESNVSEIVESTRRFIQEQVFSAGLILIVDMGSLNQIYSQIKNVLKGELLVVNNLTTSVALDIGLKMKLKKPFREIAEEANEKYQISSQYFEGFSKTQNIIISCMSGLGISNKIKEIFAKHLPEDRIEVFSKEYKELKQLINQNDESYFSKTILVITTSDLPKSFQIPNLNIYDMIEGQGKQRMESALAGHINYSDYQKLIQELVKFFSIEGVADRLNFLNPTIVMGEVEEVMAKYENYYQFSLQGKIKLNLYMHTALMLERLLLARMEKGDEPLQEMTKEEDEFYHVSKSIFQPIEMKYNFKVNTYELSLLYELLGPFINKEI